MNYFLTNVLFSYNSRGRGSYRGRGGRGGNYYRQDRNQMQQHQSISSSQHSNMSGKMSNWNQNMPNNPINYNDQSMNMMNTGGGIPRTVGGYHDGNSYHDMQSNRYEMHNQFTINHRKTFTTFYNSNKINKIPNFVYIIWFSFDNCQTKHMLHNVLFLLNIRIYKILTIIKLRILMRDESQMITL